MSDGEPRVTRRRWLGLVGAGAAGALAGCQSALPGARDRTTTTGTATTERTTRTGPDPERTREDPPRGVYTAVYREAVDSVAVLRTALGQGSCWAYDDAGRFVTNQHVVEGAETVQLHFSRDEWREGEVLATDVYSDLAVVEVADPPPYATPLPLIRGAPVMGEEVVVLGTPFGLQGTLTTGVVSGLDRSLETPTGFAIPGAVQTDAAVNPGNSGGPMLSLDAEVLGVVSAGGGENIAFGVPPQLVRRVVPALVEDGEYRHPYMGVRLVEVDPTVARANDLPEATGVIVTETIDGGPAVGVLEGSDTAFVDGRQVPVGGDVILALDDREVSSLPDLSTYLAFRTSPGDTMAVTVRRDGERRTLDLELGVRPPP